MPATVNVIVGKDEITPFLRRLGRNTDKALQETIERTILRISNLAKFHLSTRWGARSGIEYRRRSITHIASAAGEPPAPDTGNLLNSVVEDIRTLEGEVGVTAAYGGFLEEGTDTIEPRPWLAPSAEQGLASVVDDLNRELRRVVRRRR